MPDVEFLPGNSERGSGLTRARRDPVRVLAGLGALALIVTAAVVVAQGGGGDPNAGRPIAVSPSATPSDQPTLALPASEAFGPATLDLLADGNRVFALTRTLIGVADRDGGVLTVRPAPLGLGAGSRSVLRYDAGHRVIWAVSLGGTAIGAYDPLHLNSLGDETAPYRINSAAALDGRLFFTTDYGLYSVSYGNSAPLRMAGPRRGDGEITADPTRHRVLYTDRRTSSIITAWPVPEKAVTAHLPLHAGSLAVTDGVIWAAGLRSRVASLVSLAPEGLTPRALPPGLASRVLDELGSTVSIVATYGDRLLVRGSPNGASMYCLDAHTGALKQKWTAPDGPVTLNSRGVLIGSSNGIEQLNARDCLAG